ncbi:MAG: TIGR04211 family SH3 domain-containing protein [Methylicorpusculum sp.]|uniref:TIGR04211 family SH3 domain-containing protein n=1 Tax=Methylicorpusculum sp. TaxID=2713644 RepID=UPI002720E567|nr:TIGR04211 family SH3 domain-containing protein [Methylicorpusculum sp.]MDO8939252.1 TIGR04211 family SH3 domain-containing protein [Methylicorpusculum sp.]MDP2201748.1 TIGR04211 family SH3 domain-containing protein [Methylicorpusculum sp.]
MKKILGFLIFLTSITVEAKTVYVTDDLELTLRKAENDRSKIVKMIKSGTPLTLIEERSTGYSLVRTLNGVEGYFLTRHLLQTPPSAVLLQDANKKIEAFQKENDSIKAELAALKGDTSKIDSLGHSIVLERDSLNRELAELKMTAANAIEIKTERDRLQERVVGAERELQKLKRENQALIDNSNQDWFIYGGALSLAGVLLGFILPKLGWRRRSSGGWDTF